MAHIKSKILIKTSQVGYGMKLAAQLKKMGLDAVVRSNLNRLPDENYKVILMDYEDNSIPEPEHNTQIMVLTNDSDSDSYIALNHDNTERSGTYFIRKHQAIYSH